MDFHKFLLGNNMKIILLGIQGSGKSTQAKNLSEVLNIPVISIGGILRSSIEEGDEEVCRLYPKEALDAGKMAPTKLVNKLLVREMNRFDDCIIEGYPRREEQAKFILEKTIDEIVIELILPEDIAVERLKNRGRSDDEDSAILERIEVYNSEITPIRKIFKDASVYKTVVAVGSEQEVIERLLSEVRGNFE
jgi:adenylate kinase